MTCSKDKTRTIKIIKLFFKNDLCNIVNVGYLRSMNLLLEALRTSIMITGMVVVMMLMIESINLKSRGRLSSILQRNSFGQIVLSAFLGCIPGCMGGFASVSLYSHGMLSFGALVAMMIATSGDEAFVMLASFPGDALKIMGLLFVLAVITGVIVDAVRKRRGSPVNISCEELHVHEEDSHVHNEKRHFGWKRIVMAAGLVLYIAALLFGILGDGEEAQQTSGLNLLDETWMNIMFACFSVILLAVILCASDHFIEDHLWHHIICGHLPKVFAWTFGVLLAIGLASSFFDIRSWVSSNIPLMIVLATLIGIIPESGPHLVFVSLYAMGIAPASVLVASCISQDGHASLPLIAESKRDFIRAKLINCAVALAIGFAMYFIC